MSGFRMSLLCAATALAASGSAWAQVARPVALVEDVSQAPAAKVDSFDEVTTGTLIDLGPKGVLKLSYYASCRQETITGGKVTVGTDQSAVQGGKVQAQKGQCDTKRFAVTTQTAEPGATINRALESPFDSSTWEETTIKSPHPIFRWDGGAATVSVKDESGKLVWSGKAPKKFLEYPANAPKLETGAIYLVEAATDAGVLHTKFSIDPDIELSDSVTNRTLPLKAGKTAQAGQKPTTPPRR